MSTDFPFTVAEKGTSIARPELRVVTPFDGAIRQIIEP